MPIGLCRPGLLLMTDPYTPVFRAIAGQARLAQRRPRLARG